MWGGALFYLEFGSQPPAACDTGRKALSNFFFLVFLLTPARSRRQSETPEAGSPPNRSRLRPGNERRVRVLFPSTCARLQMGRSLIQLYIRCKSWIVHKTFPCQMEPQPGACSPGAHLRQGPVSCADLSCGGSPGLS